MEIVRGGYEANPCKSESFYNPTCADRVLSIEYPLDGKLRSRKVISRSKARSTGKYPSWKMGRPMHWESPHELNAFRHLDATPTVVEFHEQPLKIRFLLNGVEHCHYPDVLVKRKGSQELWEIKPACDAEVPEVMARTRLLQRDLPRMGFTYQMVMGDRLSEEPRLSNVLKILKCGRNPISIVEYEQLRQLFQDGREITWASAQDALGANRSRLLCRAFLMGHICFDIEQQIVQEAKFWWTGGLNGRQVS